MNRRGFFRTLAAATAGFTILPPATTYQRIWKATIRSPWQKIPWEVAYVDYPALFDPRIYMGEWKFISCGSPAEKD